MHKILVIIYDDYSISWHSVTKITGINTTKKLGMSSKTVVSWEHGLWIQMVVGSNSISPISNYVTGHIMKSLWASVAVSLWILTVPPPSDYHDNK